LKEKLKETLRTLETEYSWKSFQGIIEFVKREKINDDELFQQIEDLSIKRFRNRVSLTLGVTVGNLIESLVTIVAVVLAFQMNSDRMLYIAAFILMTTLHPLSHYVAGYMAGIRFTHYYLNGPAKIEPTLRIDHFSYLKASGKKRALMHVSGVVGTLAGPIVAAFIAFWKVSSEAAFNLVILFLLLIVFELLTSTRIGDLMKAKREYGYG
jgi:ABC-type multidrug transport system fused ATPase/permease subunit